MKEMLRKKEKGSHARRCKIDQEPGEGRIMVVGEDVKWGKQE